MGRQAKTKRSRLGIVITNRRTDSSGDGIEFLTILGLPHLREIGQKSNTVHHAIWSVFALKVTPLAAPNHARRSTIFSAELAFPNSI